ncbi:hypothetical protein [Blastococcus sp. SYSU D00820]
MRAALVAGAVLLLAGCTATVDGTPSASAPAPPSQLPPPTGVAGALDLEELVGHDALVVLGVVPTPDGGWLVHVVSSDDDHPGWLVPVAPGDDGPVAGEAADLPELAGSPEVLVAPDGTVVLAEFLPDGSFALLTREPGAGGFDVREIDPFPASEESSIRTALSPDGGTVYLLAGGRGDEGPARLLAVDVASGAVTAETDAGLQSDEETLIGARLAADAGGPAVLATLRGGELSRVTLTRFGPDLRPDGDPVPLTDGEQPDGTALALTADGTAVVAAGVGDTGSVSVFVVAGGEVRDEIPLDDAEEAPLGLAVTADGTTALVPVRAGTATVVTTVDLGSGALDDIPLCDAIGDVGRAALSADGGALLLTGSCTDDADGALSAVVLR